MTVLPVILLDPAVSELFLVGNASRAAAVTPYFTPALSFPFSRNLPLKSFSPRELNAPLFYSYVTPDYSFSFVNN